MPLSVAILKSRDFRCLLLTRMFILMALMAQDVIIGWQVYSITHSAFILGLTGLTEAVPAICCALFAGHVVDISRPHRVYMVCTLVLLLNSFGLFLVAGGILPIAGSLLPWIFGGVFLSGLSRSFIMPASFSLLPRIVPRTSIASASGWLNSGFQIASITGPAVAGIIYGGYGTRAAWLLPVSLMTMGFLMLFGIGGSHRHYRSSERREKAVKSIKAGWRFIFSHRVLLSIMALDMFAVLFGGAVAMLPAFADQVLHVGSEGLGALRAAPAMGAIVSALVLALKPFKHIRATLLLWVITGFGTSIICFGLSHVFWLAALFLALSGAFDSVSMVIRSTLMQLMTPDAMRGRVSAVNSMFIISSNEIGAFESGTMAKFLGLVPSIVFGGCATLVVVAITAALSPQLRRTVIDANAAAPV